MSVAEDVIVIVEDDPDDRHLLARAFKKAGISVPVRFAVDGDEAVELLRSVASEVPRSARPLVILLDLKLPRRSGFEVLGWLKAHPVLRATPVVILTSSRESVDLDRAYELGANSYLVKPTQPQDLQSLIAEVGSYWLSRNEPVPFRAS